YKKLLRFNQLRARTRPAEYDHIPDVVNGPISPVVAIIIGLALSAVGALLAPKPQEPEQRKERKKVRQEQLPNQVGPSRFNQTSSFDGYAALIDYGTPVQIPFGKMGEAGDGAISGGLVLAGSLVWSRAYSYGTYQRVKMLYTLGEHILAAPNLKGIWLGTQSLSAVGAADFALYWKSQSGENRIQMANRIAGSQGQPWSGDPDTQQETFIAPVDGTIEGRGFCMVNNPNSKAVFGQYNPIRNGTAHRTNWQVLSVPISPLKESGEDDAAYDPNKVRNARAERIKVGGEFSSRLGLAESARDKAGQPGLGRAYGCYQGLIAYAKPGEGWTECNDKVPFLEGIGPDWLVKYHLGAGTNESLDYEDYQFCMEGDPEDYGITHKDIASATKSRREQADDLLVIGSRWMIGSTQWVVESRTPEVWRDERTVDVVLRCVSTSGINRIGIAGKRACSEPLGGYEGPWDEQLIGSPRPAHITELGFNQKKHCGAAFWNVVQYEVATVRMMRAADTVEFGIASTVWNQASGLCNFNAIPTPSQLWKKDQNDIQLSSPTLSRYFKRTSCFSLWVRPIVKWNERDETPPNWARLDPVFCVTGDSPREMFNYLRIRPRSVGELYEFRFIPRVGSDIATNSWRDVKFWQLSAAGGVVGEDFSTQYGDFRVTMNGQKVSVNSVLVNSELLSDATAATTLPTTRENQPTGITNYAWSTGADWRKNAFLTHFLGNAHNLPVGTFRSAEVVHFKQRGAGGEDDGWIKVRISATVNNTSGPRHAAYFGTNKNWAGNGSGISFTVVADRDTRGFWQQGGGDLFTITAPINASNPYQVVGYSSVGAAFRVTSTRENVIEGGVILGDEERMFESASQVSDCSHYDEISKSCDNGPEHRISYVNFAVSEATDEGTEGIPQYEDLTMMGLSLKSGPAIGAIEQPRIWVNGGIGVDRLNTNGVYGVSNLLTDLLYYLLTNKKQGLGEIIPPELVDRDSLKKTGEFLLQNRIFWNGVVESDENFRSFATDQAAKHLCIFTIKNGIFGMMPALPVDGSGAISRSPIQAEGLFCAGNILDGSFKLTFIPTEDRRNTAMTVRWRRTVPYELPEERTARVAFAGTDPRTVEDYDLTQSVDNDYQALMSCRYAMAARAFIDHTVEFQTTPEAVGIEPGSYIRVIVEETEFLQGQALKVNDDLTFNSPAPVDDGTYPASVYVPGEEDVREVELVIKKQKVTNTELRGAIASLFTCTEVGRFYQVSEITLGEDGLVNIVASVVPTNGDNSSKLAEYALNPDLFDVMN
ncbi:MAG: hypothetical protein CMA72_08715, partial [Euryarchaeota archaeon]|nr:hypothetical protein [Euryarchaeota archaeon]